MRKRSRWLICCAAGLALAVALVALLSGSDSSQPVEAAASGGVVPAVDLSAVESELWVERLVPEKCSPGVNLVQYHRRLPMLIDMNGRIVHAWPGVSVTGRARLERDGRLTVIGTDETLKSYSWEGELLWQFKPEPAEDFPHHDFTRLANGNLLVPLRTMSTETDNLVEIDGDGKVVWEWRSHDYLKSDFPYYSRSSTDPTHINSVRELPANYLFDGGDVRFRPGNILVSARNLSTIFIIDRTSSEVVWTFRDGLLRQHEAIMIPQGHLWQGCIMLFNNWVGSPPAERRSAIQVIDPLSGTIVWEYSRVGFFSSVAGSQMVLANGNLLITSSSGGRAFEITPEGETVWQWLPPFRPMRVERYPLDHAPQLADLKLASPEAVQPATDTPHIDLELYSYFTHEEAWPRDIGGKQTRVLHYDNLCREVWFPPDKTSISFRWGLNRHRFKGRSVSARFWATLRPTGDELIRKLVDCRVDSGDEQLWHSSTVPLFDMAGQRGTICLSVVEIGGSASLGRAAKAIVWGPPITRSKWLRSRIERNPFQATRETAANEAKQLKALGYVQ
jgi:outer membrane protein assembly factor BamB